VIKLEQRGFTIVELLISIGILGIVAPLLALALFQILTFTERSRAGFEAQADTRNASAWISQDIVMAQETNLPAPPDFIDERYCYSDAEAEWATFTWTDRYKDRDDVYTVSYCLIDSASADLPPDPNPFPTCRVPDTKEPGICLVRNFGVIDSEGNTTSDGIQYCSMMSSCASIVIARNIVSVKFVATPESEISVTIQSSPKKNRFVVGDVKTFKVVMRPNAPTA